MLPMSLDPPSPGKEERILAKARRAEARSKAAKGNLIVPRPPKDSGMYRSTSQGGGGHGNSWQDDAEMEQEFSALDQHTATNPDPSEQTSLVVF